MEGLICWLWPLLGSLLGLLAGYLIWNRRSNSNALSISQLTDEREEWKKKFHDTKNQLGQREAKIVDWESKYNSLSAKANDTSKVDGLNAEISSWKSKFGGWETEKASLLAQLAAKPREVEKVVEVEKVIEVEKIVEVEKPVEVIKEVEKIVEVEKVVEVEKIVEVEKVIEKPADMTAMNALTAERNDWKSKYEALQAEKKAAPAAMAPKAETPKPAPAAKPDDLTEMEGIGPKVNEILNKNGVTTFAQLASTDPKTIKSWLEAAGSRFKLQNPRSWPDQAELARDGKKAELDKLQDYLVAGVYPEDMDSGGSGGGKSDPDDLTKIEGIGPKVQEVLNNGGIYTFKELASSDVSKIQGLLDAAGSRFKMQNPGTWPKQSALARDGKWDDLEKLQDELDGGV